MSLEGLNLQQEILKLCCSVCLELLNDPVLLPCAHSLCRECLYGKRKNGVVTCPACRVIFEADESNLEDNVLGSKIIEALKGQERKRTIQCERCDECQAQYSCEQCNLLFCSNCCDMLHKGKMKNHKVNVLDVTQQRSMQRCKVKGHDEYPLNLFCATTVEFICLLCQQDKRHQGHEIIPTLKAANTAKLELQTWMPITVDQKGKLKHLVKSIDYALENVEKSSENELLNLHELLNTLMDKLEGQAKHLADTIIERKITEVTRLCYARKEVLDVVGKLNDEMARVQRVCAQSDPVEIVKAKVDILKKPQPMSIYLPQYTLPVVGPKMALGSCFNVDFVTSKEHAVRVDDIDEAMYNCWCLIPMDRGQVLVNSIGLDWKLDKFEAGDFITLSNNGLAASTDCEDCYEQSSVCGTVGMETGVWYWKVRLLNLVNHNRVCFGVTEKPFDQIRSNPYKRMWGWASSGSALPAYERQSEKAKLMSGDSVWIKLDADKGIIYAYWPHSGLQDSIEIGSRARGKPLYPVFTLGYRGNTVEVEPVPIWELDIPSG